MNIEDILTKWAAPVKLENQIKYYYNEDETKLTKIIWKCSIGEVTYVDEDIKNAVFECDKLAKKYYD